MNIKITNNLDDSKVRNAIIDKITKDVFDHVEPIAKDAALTMKKTSLGGVDPKVERLNKEEHGMDGVIITISKPKEIQIAEKLRLVKKAFLAIKAKLRR